MGLNRNNEYAIGLSSIGDGAHELEIFTGTPPEIFKRLIDRTQDLKLFKRFDVVIARSEAEVREGFIKKSNGAGRPKRGDSPHALSRVADLLADIEWKD